MNFLGEPYEAFLSLEMRLKKVEEEISRIKGKLSLVLEELNFYSEVISKYLVLTRIDLVKMEME